MTYVTNLKSAQIAGIDVKVVNENLGTGDSSTSSFDLLNRNILSSSYTLSYASSGSNDFTTLTETTDYVLDKASGRVELTSTGVTTLSTNLLFAEYSYVDDITDTEITDFEVFAEAEVEKLTGQTWDTITSVTEYFDGRQKETFPQSDYPYSHDWDEPDFFVLTKTPITSIGNVYFLNRGASVGKVWSYDLGTTTYTDNTSEANTVEGTSFYAFAEVPAVGDIIYVGAGQKFLGVRFDLAVVGTGSPVIDWEYYNGTAWADITETETDTGSSTLTADGLFTWTMPDSWSKVSVNSSSSLYYVRGKVSTAYTISPKVYEVSLDQNSVIETTVSAKNIDFTNWGKMTLLSNSIPNGTRNVKVTYNYGASVVPALVEELTGILVAIRCFVKLSGGSYDNFTSVNSGAVSATIGEQYVNIREVISQFKARIKEILDLLGKRADIAIAVS